MKSLSLIVPAFNEEENIRPFYERVCRVFADYGERVEIIFVDDGSHDHTYEKIAAISRRPYAGGPVLVKGISFSRNFGKEAAMLAGLRRAGGEYLAIIDADLQQDPAYVLRMAALLDQNEEIDVVAAFQRERKEGRVQSLLKSAFYKVADRLSDVHLEENASDFRTFRRPVRDAMLSLTETNRFSKGIFAWVGFKTMYIPYEVEERQHGQSSWSVRKLFHYAMDGIEGYSTAGLKLSFAVGTALLAASVIWLAAGRILSANLLLTLIPFLVLLVGAFQMFGIGILGDYLGRTYAETKNRPAYIIRRECGKQEEADGADGNSPKDGRLRIRAMQKQGVKRGA